MLASFIVRFSNLFGEHFLYIYIYIHRRAQPLRAGGEMSIVTMRNKKSWDEIVKDLGWQIEAGRLRTHVMG